MRVKCKRAGEEFLIEASVRKATPGLPVTFRLDGDPNTDWPKIINRRGEAKVKFTGVGPEEHTVEVLECELRKDVSCKP